MANTDYKFARDNNIYVIAGLPIESQVKYKYYASIKEAIDDAPAGSCVIVEAGTYLISSPSIYYNIPINKNLNIHFNAGAVIKSTVLNTFIINSGNVNITGYLQAIVSNVFIQTLSTTNDTINIEIDKITNISSTNCLDLRSTGVFNIKIKEISAPLSNTAIGIRNMNISSVLEVSKIDSQILLTPNLVSDTISGTIKNTFLKGSLLGGMLYLSDNAVISITLQNCKIYNTNNVAGASGIEHVSGYAGATVKLINTVIQTTHASSASISTDDTLTLMALSSWANKAVSGTVTETVTGGYTVDADVKA